MYKTYQKIVGASNIFKISREHAQYTEEKAAILLKDKILEGKPLLVTRFGANELNCVLNHYFINKNLITKLLNLSKGYPYGFKIKKGVVNAMRDNAGFFSASVESLKRYSQMTLNELKHIDVLASWQYHEKFLFNLLPDKHMRIRIRDLSPITNPKVPWTMALKGKKVLVVHPFEETIKLQYKKRKLLFENENMLPEFELITLKAVQTIAGNGKKTGFKDWFEALNYMKSEIDKKKFDIAILGCGAYGMPLAVHIKRIGKQAIHVGGETQILFGIKGKRWESPSYNYQNICYNEHWIRPLNSDIPINSEKVEDGCYW